jgi:hypothetical protein
MPTFIEYQLEDGATILVQTMATEGAQGTLRKAGITDAAGNAINAAGQKFSQALAGVKQSAQIIRTQLDELKADQVEVTFSLTATGDFGNFAIGQVGGEANYKVVLKWNNQGRA